MVSILDLAHDAGIDPIKTATTLGGEWHSPCPACQGVDRFCIWPNSGTHGRYWCRQCNVKGDFIQFCRDFLRTSFKDACEKITGGNYRINPVFARRPSSYEIIPSCPPKKLWVEKAEEFVESAHRRLMVDSESLTLVKARGLSEETIRTHRIGWNPITNFQFRLAWGLGEDGERKKLCIPRGIVIPTYGVVESSALRKIKVRRSDWNEGDRWPKYYEIPGSSKTLSVYGFRTGQTAILVESEFDAMTIFQESDGFCSGVALGGAQKKPDKETFEWLMGRKLILYSLDCDDAGRSQYEYWRSMLHNLRAWLSASHKSPADSLLKGGVNLRDWCLAGISYWEDRM